jgi:hypothetical protein
MAITDPSPPPREGAHKSFLSKILPFTTVGVIIAALYVAWTFYSRYQGNKQAMQRIQAEHEVARKRVVDQIYGSGEIRFTTFGADSGLLKRGERTELCYGVVNAKNVKVDPPVGETKPSYHHCIEIAPEKTTTYTITADDGAGHSKSESLTIRVQ